MLKLSEAVYHALVIDDLAVRDLFLPHGGDCLCLLKGLHLFVVGLYVHLPSLR